MTTTDTTRSRVVATAGAGLFALASVAGLAACSDEDGDGGQTDEEIQDIEEGVDEAEEDIEDGVDEAEDEVNEEIDAQNEGDNEG